MAIHIQTDPRQQTIPMRALAADFKTPFARKLFAILVPATLTMALMLFGWPNHSSPSSPGLQDAIAESLVRDTPGTPDRLVRAQMTDWGDLNVEFVLRDRPEAQSARAAALDDILVVTHAVYQTPERRPLNLTLIGEWRDSASATARPVVYASMPADQFVGRDWTALRTVDVERLGVVRWLPAGLCQAWNDCVASMP